MPDPVSIVLIAIVSIIVILMILGVSGFIVYNQGSDGSVEPMAEERSISQRTKKVAVCFFGLTRSLEYTYASIRNNIINRLKSMGFEIDIYLHTYNLEYIRNSRSNEDNIMNTSEWKLLKAKKFIIDSQEEFDESYDYTYVESLGDPWNTNFQNTHNLVRQLNSLNRVTSLWKNSGESYDLVFYFRPDLMYIDPITEADVVKGYESVVTPSWQRHQGYNERFAWSKPEYMEIYGSRFNQISSYKKPLHSEKFCKHVLENIRVEFTDMSAIRVRSNGTLCHSDKFI